MTESENWYRVTRWLDSEEDCKFAKATLEGDGIKTKFDLDRRTGKVALFRCPPPIIIRSEREQKEFSLKKLQDL